MVFLPNLASSGSQKIHAYIDPERSDSISVEPCLPAARAQKKSLYLNSDGSFHSALASNFLNELRDAVRQNGMLTEDGIDTAQFLALCKKHGLQLFIKSDQRCATLLQALITKFITNKDSYLNYLQHKDSVGAFEAQVFVDEFMASYEAGCPVLSTVLPDRIHKLKALDLFLEQNHYQDKGLPLALMVEFINTLVQSETLA